jgi:hypothetical protein
VRQTFSRQVAMTRHALERDGDVRLRRSVQIALRGRQMEILDRPDEGRAVARVVGVLQDDPARIARETLHLAAVARAIQSLVTTASRIFWA